MPTSESVPGLPARRRLSDAVAKLDDAGRTALANACRVPRAAVSRAAAGWRITAPDFLTLCDGVGIDPVNGARRPTRRRARMFSWPSVAIALNYKRQVEGLSIRVASEAVGISIATISRLENLKPLSIESLLAVCAFLKVHPSSFAQDDLSHGTECNTLKSKEAA